LGFHAADAGGKFPPRADAMVTLPIRYNHAGIVVIMTGNIGTSQSSDPANDQLEPVVVAGAPGSPIA